MGILHNTNIYIATRFCGIKINALKEGEIMAKQGKTLVGSDARMKLRETKERKKKMAENSGHW